MALERVSVRLRHTRIHAQDCAECETKGVMLDRIECVVELEGALDADQRARLFDISGKCPVRRTLTSEISIQSRLQG
jgi:putative redox protein